MLRVLLAVAGVFLLQPLSTSAADAAKDRANPLLIPWDGPHGGVPPFDRIRVEDFAPALEAAMIVQRREIAVITANPAAPTTRRGARLRRTSSRNSSVPTASRSRSSACGNSLRGCSTCTCT